MRLLTAFTYIAMSLSLASCATAPTDGAVPCLKSHEDLMMLWLGTMAMPHYYSVCDVQCTPESKEPICKAYFNKKTDNKNAH